MDSFTVRVEKLVYGGEGLAYHGGKPVFVSFVLPGEVVDVFPIEESRKFIRALPAQVKEAAGERIAADCPYFGRCGGCHYQHLPYERQLEVKRDILHETLRRLGKIERTEEIALHASPPWHYRNRVQLKLAPHPVAADRLQVGFHRAGSRTLCGIEQCPISSPKLNQLISVLNRLSAEGALPLSLRAAEALADDRDHTLWLTLAAPQLDFDRAALAERLRTELDGLLSLQSVETSTERTETDGLGWIYYQVGAERLRVSHASFFQINRHLLPVLVERVTQNLEGKVALDLYAGVGLFTRALARKFARVVAVESSTAAAADLAANVADLAGVETRASSVLDFLRQSPEKSDLALLDPPRCGLGRGVAEALNELAPPRLLYLSCDPSTLARDLARLAPHYRLVGLELFDLFPQTFHIETLARLDRAA
ncbi:MAG: class I SAM-dependent RNA methyltransferase [Acidobacteria bacterium]|nr:class I SAM-dependent RNA methyltransferase [Acidobacteriota bacterium]